MGAEEELLLVHDGPAPQILDETIFRAFRDDRAPRLYFEGESQPLPEIVTEAVRRGGTLARELNCEAELDQAVRMACHGNGADRQREHFAQGGMAGLLRSLMEETATPAALATPVAG